MSEVKDKLVTVEGMHSLHRYAESTYLKAITGNITISVDGWFLDEATNYLKLNIENTNVTADSSVYINLNMVSVLIAEDCGLKGVTESFDGGFSIYAESVPTAEMTGTITIQSGGAI